MDTPILQKGRMMPTINEVVDNQLRSHMKREQKIFKYPTQYVQQIEDFLYNFNTEPYPHTTKDIAAHFQWMQTHCKKDYKEAELISMLDVEDGEVESYPWEIQNNIFRMTASKTTTHWSLDEPNLVASRVYTFDGDEWQWKSTINQVHVDEYETQCAI